MNEGSKRHYPDGMDFGWLAADSEGQVAFLITAGRAPIPSHLLNLDDIILEDLELLVCNLPRVSEAQLTIPMEHAESYIEIAQRGFFVYDWTDAHRSFSERICGYEQVALPVNPIRCDQLPNQLADVARLSTFADIRFGGGGNLDVLAFFPCSEP